MTDWVHAGTSILPAFLASLVEFVEALTVVLAIGIVRGWRSALAGTGLALAVLLVLVAVLGPALQNIPLDWIQLVIGVLLLLFGMRWLRRLFYGRPVLSHSMTNKPSSRARRACSASPVRRWLQAGMRVPLSPPSKLSCWRGSRSSSSWWRSGPRADSCCPPASGRVSR